MENESNHSINQTNSQFTDERKYTFEDREFIVRSAFKTDCQETLGTVLLRLIKSEMD